MVELSWPRVVALILVVGLLGFAVATFVQRDRPMGEDTVDVRFLQDMDVHHDQALRMARMELVDGKESEVLGLAREILTVQSWEMGAMEQALRQWGHSSGETDRPDVAMEWMDMEVPLDEMPGLMSDGRMDELERAEGRTSDVLFLEMMAEHHVGGIHMAEHAAEHAGTEEVRDLAARMARNQASEVNLFVEVAERRDLPAAIDRVPVPELPGSGG